MKLVLERNFSRLEVASCAQPKTRKYYDETADTTILINSQDNVAYDATFAVIRINDIF